ncbi:MAG: hypothetical protein ACP5KI_06955, partial [Brevinematia bacterium]
INNIEETSQISKSQLLEMENIIESIRIISINCYILSNKTKGDNTFELLSKEILSKVERLENTISYLSKINTLLTYLTSELLNKKQELISKFSSIQPKEKPSEELIYELQTRNTESAKILEQNQETNNQIIEITNKALEDMEKLQKHLSILSDFSNELQIIQENYQSLIDNMNNLSHFVEEVYNNLKEHLILNR